MIHLFAFYTVLFDLSLGWLPLLVLFHEFKITEGVQSRGWKPAKPKI